MSKRDDLLKQLGGGASRGMVADSPPPGLDPAAAQGPAHSPGMTRRKDVFNIPLDRIEPDPDQPRQDFDPDALGRLAESLRTRGQLQPIRVRKEEGRGVYTILMGERRWRAAGLAGLAELACVVHDDAPDGDERLALQLVENALREDLRPVEQARAYRRLMDSQGWSISQLARELAVSQAAASKALALLELPEGVQEQVDAGRLSASAGYEISRLEDAEQAASVAEAAAAEGLKRGEVAELVRAVKAKRPAPAQRPEPVTLDLGDGCTITVRWRNAGGPELVQAMRRGLKLAQQQGRVFTGNTEGEAA